MVEGRDPSWLHSGEIIDAALRSTRFKDLIRQADLGNGETEWLRFDEEDGLWEVGILDFRPEPSLLQAAHVHPATGEIVEFVERPWVNAVDGNA